MNDYDASLKNTYKLFLLTDERFIDKYALLSVLMVKLCQFVPCHISISDDWVCLNIIEETSVPFFSYFMDGYVNVFQD
ncbi:TPA: hypothetical protein ACK11E_002277 [Citrobacter pasteurii]|uniref:hypothetical protein n=1 Tax=Citrobacter sp. Cu233 TaxID=2985160 RepID=UPI00257907AE|nr:hypothetical protein [Citrobacter sp. Cu233]MDM2932071.1 hypothetical protein [Citrobacter sp. Cu233]